MNNKILFLGVGGIGVSALAIAAHELGASCSGHDSNKNYMTAKLETLGINIYSNLNDIYITDYDLIVFSSAINANNSILTQAKNLNIQTLHRSKFLDIIMQRFDNAIAITGTHGKTTTSSVLSEILYQLDNSTSFLVGGLVKKFNSNIAINGTSSIVIEADESDASFLNIHPNTVILTNIDLDHMNTYENCYDRLLESFYNFLNKESVKNIIICIDDIGCNDLLKKYNFNGISIITYGYNKNADINISNYLDTNEKTTFDITVNGQKHTFSTKLPGKYNISNITACITYSLIHKLNIKNIIDAVSNVLGVKRRFDVYTKQINNMDITIIDDYGHHPVEVASCLSAIKDRYPSKKIIQIFQPHRYSRNRDLFNDWIKALSIADTLILMPTFSAGESISSGIGSIELSQKLENAILANDFEHAIAELHKNTDSNTIVLVQGAGDITNIIEML